MAYTDIQIDNAKETIIQGMIDGESVSNILSSNKDMPSIRTVFNWLNPNSDYHDGEFLHNYAQAQEIRAENEFNEILKIADDQEDDVYIDKDGKEQTNHNVIARSRLRVDSRKWRISKMSPKKYGDRVLHGSDPDNPMPPTSIPLVLTNGKTYEDLKNELKPE